MLGVLSDPIMGSDPTLTFHGAARTVTGSCLVLEAAGKSVMIDCGLFQGSRSLEELNQLPFAFSARQIDALILTHAHIDHCGLTPCLVQDGFRGPIYCTEPTRDLLEFTLPDAGRIQESEAERSARRRTREGREPFAPLYTEADALEVLEYIQTVDLEEWFDLGAGIRARFWNAGHILGAVSVELVAGNQRFLFSGDLGPDEKAFHPEPNAPQGFDVVVCESTYGDREKPEAPLPERRRILEQEVKTALARGGNLLIPAFAIERTQELLLDLALLMNSGKLNHTPIFIDSPLATKATSVFRKYRYSLEDMGDTDIFRHPSFHYVETAAHSMQLNRMSGAIIIAASGMCEGGRIRHHLKHNLWRPDSTVLFVGYQAAGTLGRIIVDGAKHVRISGDDVAVNCQVRRLDFYSAHADQHELVNWIKERLPIRGTLFLDHGEGAALQKLAELATGLGIGQNRIIQPRIGEKFRIAAEEAAHSLGGERITADMASRDWQNEYSALILDFKNQLKRIQDARKRRELLEKMRRILNDVANLSS